MGITGTTRVIACNHVNLQEFEWLCITAGEAPAFFYCGLPISGMIRLSKLTIEVVCDKCYRLELSNGDRKIFEV